VPTLYLAATAYEQAGAVAYTEELIRTIESEDGEAEHPDPAVNALAAHRRGWLYVEQYGLYQDGIEQFQTSLAEARCCDAGLAYSPYPGHLPLPLKLQVENHHWLLITHAMKAMDEARSYLSAYPRHGPLPSPATQAALQRSLDEDWSPWIKYDEENLNQYYRKFEVDTLLTPQLAWANLQANLRDHSSVFKHWDADHLLWLASARRSLVHTEWAEDHLAEAISKARDARLGYCRMRFPPGMALCLGIEARARFEQGLDRMLGQEYREAAYKECLDRLVLVIMLHHFKMHPLWREAAGLIFAVCMSASKGLRDGWLGRYKGDLRARIAQYDGVFDSLKNLDFPLSVEPMGELETARKIGALYWRP
jgi:hypothetical protein